MIVDCRGKFKKTKNYWSLMSILVTGAAGFIGFHTSIKKDWLKNFKFIKDNFFNLRKKFLIY